MYVKWVHLFLENWMIIELVGRNVHLSVVGVCLTGEWYCVV